MAGKYKFAPILVTGVFVVLMTFTTGVNAQSCDTTAYLDCVTTYTNAVAGQSDTTTLCNAYNAFVTCATNSNCLNNISVANPCSSGALLTGSVFLLIAAILLQIVNRE